MKRILPVVTPQIVNSSPRTASRMAVGAMLMFSLAGCGGNNSLSDFSAGAEDSLDEVSRCSVAGPTSRSLAMLPGPAVLYADAPDLPQLQNRHPRFVAEPILVSGHEAYINGEYLYQDHLFDDYGSETSGAPPSTAILTSPPTGTATPDALDAKSGDVSYPNDPTRYGNNAADLVEFRIAPGASDIAYRITLSTLLTDDTTLIAIAWNRDPDALVPTGVATLTRDPGLLVPGTDEIIYLWGDGGEHVDIGTGTTTTLTVTTDLEANQITAFLPRSIHDPTGVWNATLLAGLDDGSHNWLFTGPPGPADASPSAIYNVGFRFNEFCLSLDTPCDTRQALVLRNKDVSEFSHPIDFDLLAAGTNQTSVPNTGTLVRIFPSRLDEGEGRNTSFQGRESDQIDFFSPLQPYSIYIPSNYDSTVPTKLTWAGHSLTQFHWQYNGTQYHQQVGEARDSLVVTPHSRGPAGWYNNRNEYDFFEVWNDVNRHYHVDMRRVAATGYSMGGHMTFRMTGLYPDLFGTAFTQVGPAGAGIWTGQGSDGSTGGYHTLTNYWLENLRNIPYYSMVAITDELVPITSARQQTVGGVDATGLAQSFEDLGYRYIYQEFSTGEHFTLFLHDNYPDATAFLGDSLIDPNPSRVTFSYIPATDNEPLGLIHDRAYWVSDLVLRDTSDTGMQPAKGTVDGYSLGFGEPQPGSMTLPPVPGSLSGNTGVLAFTQFERQWQPGAPIAAENRLQLSLTNLDSVIIDLNRASLSADSELTVETTADDDSSVLFSGSFNNDTTIFEDGVEICTVAAGSSGALVPVSAGVHVYSLAP